MLKAHQALPSSSKLLSVPRHHKIYHQVQNLNLRRLPDCCSCCFNIVKRTHLLNNVLKLDFTWKTIIRTHFYVRKDKTESNNKTILLIWKKIFSILVINRVTDLRHSIAQITYLNSFTWLAKKGTREDTMFTPVGEGGSGRWSSVTKGT